VELHTDHLEAHYSPRPGVRWGLTAAIQAHDAQVVTSGITTVFDCLRMGSDEDGGFEKGEMRAMANAIAEAQNEDRLRAEHLIHLRCEVSTDNVLDHYEEFEDDPACPPRLADGSRAPVSASSRRWSNISSTTRRSAA
jgi:alpha-D-ribose 1-methylphosphonate 5-triphosphate diphosphatase